MKQINYISYEKINSNFNKYQLSESNYRLFKKTDWIVTEKIHGANFCVVTDGQITQYGKRKEILPEGTVFFAHTSLTKQLEIKAINIFNHLKNINPEIEQVSIYGELFGGEYPHRDVQPNLNVQAIQTGVYYSPNIEFIAFDIAYSDRHNSRRYLDCDRLIDLCQQADLLCTPILFRGKYEDALNYDINFTSTIPNLLGYPALDFSNLAEGIVIKPAIPLVIDTIKGKLRPVLKIKTPAFSEDKRFHQAQKWHTRHNNQVQAIAINSKTIETEILALITRNRFNNLISKIGKPKKLSQKKIKYILKLYTEDVIEEVQDNLNIVFDNLDPEIQQQYITLIHKQAKQFFS